MIFYFATTSLTQDQKSPIEYDLNHDTIYYCTLDDTPGKVFDSIRRFQKEYDDESKKPFAICKGIISDESAVGALVAAIYGNVVRHQKILVEEITWIT